MNAKTPRESETIMTEVVLPNDTNALHNLRGGKILHWMDIASAIAAGRHAQAVVVTVSVDNVSFENPIKLGDVVTIKAKVTRVFRTSIETFIEVTAENIPTKNRYKCNTAYYTFVSLDSNGKPTPAPQVILETDEDQEQHVGAMRRRELRLILSGRLKPNDSSELRSLFEAASQK